MLSQMTIYAINYQEIKFKGLYKLYDYRHFIITEEYSEFKLLHLFKKQSFLE